MVKETFPSFRQPAESGISTGGPVRVYKPRFEKAIRRSFPLRFVVKAARGGVGRVVIAVTLLVFGPALPAQVPENNFVYAQLRHPAQWDPYPAVWDQLRSAVEQTTSVSVWPERRLVTLEDPALFESPFLVLTGKGSWSLGEPEKQKLRNYLAGGGFLFIDNTEAERQSAFARSVLPALEGLFPGTVWKDVPLDHAVFRSFFLLRRVAGRRLAESSLKGLWIQDRLAAIYSPNDLHGALARDPLGNFLHTVEPGGEIQRTDSGKLLANIVLFSLTGTYKTDAIHQPFLERKLQP